MKKQGREYYSHRQTAVEFCTDLWSATAQDPKTSLIVSGGASHGDGNGLGCLFLSRVLVQKDGLDLRKDHWLPISGGVTCLANVATFGDENEYDMFMVGTDLGTVSFVQVNKYNAQFLDATAVPTPLYLPSLDGGMPCTTTAISAAARANDAVVVVTDSGGVYMATSLAQNPQVMKFQVRENSSINDVTHLQDTSSFVTAGASPVAQLKVWDPRVSASEGSAVVATFQDEDPSVAYTSVSSHPTDKHLVMTGTSKGHLCVWDIRQGRVRNRIKKHSGRVTSVRFAVPKSQHVYTTCSDGAALFWDFKANAMNSDNIVSYYDHEASITKCTTKLLWDRPLGVAACANAAAVPSDGKADLVCVAYDGGTLVVSEM